MYGDKSFTRTAIHAWCKKFASDNEVQSTVRQRLRQQPASFFSHQAFTNLLTDGINVYMNLHDMLKNETLMFGI